VLWLLIALVLLLSLAVLAATLLGLWRRVKVLGRQVSAAGERVEELTGAIDGARADGPLGAGPCPKCGAPPRASPAATRRTRPRPLTAPLWRTLGLVVERRGARPCRCPVAGSSSWS
jgi:hypothetical protein